MIHMLTASSSWGCSDSASRTAVFPVTSAHSEKEQQKETLKQKKSLTSFCSNLNMSFGTVKAAQTFISDIFYLVYHLISPLQTPCRTDCFINPSLTNSLHCQDHKGLGSTQPLGDCCVFNCFLKTK